MHFFSYILFTICPFISLFGDVNPPKEDLVFQWQSHPHFDSSKRIFVDAFYKCYDTLSLDVLHKESKEELIHWLEDTFDETYVEHEKNVHLRWLAGIINSKTVGFIIVDTLNLPDEIYLVQFAVDPPYQRSGLGTKFINEIIRQFPGCKKLSVVTRRANYESVNFYNKFGFLQSAYAHEGYSPEIYQGFEFFL